MGDARDEDAVGRLRAELHTLGVRYGEHAAPPQLARLDRSMLHRRRRAHQLEEEIAMLTADLRCIEAELAGYERAVEALLIEEIDRIRAVHHEAWSPGPVLGFRYWLVAGDGLRGFRTVWRTPAMRAVCTTTGNADDVPHSDGRCGRLGCGVYAAKRLEPLAAELADMAPGGFVIGLVALSGKVVEHERGYRAAAAETVAVAAVSPGRLVAAGDAAAVAEVFAAPVRALRERADDVFGGEALSRAVEFVNIEYELRRSPWT